MRPKKRHTLAERLSHAVFGRHQIQPATSARQSESQKIDRAIEDVEKKLIRSTNLILGISLITITVLIYYGVIKTNNKYRLTLDAYYNVSIEFTRVHVKLSYVNHLFLHIFTRFCGSASCHCGAYPLPSQLHMMETDLRNYKFS